MNEIVNIAAYKFVPLEDLPHRRDKMLALCQRLALKGTVLLTPEGINLFLAGTRSAIDILLGEIRAESALADLQAKESHSQYQPFSRLLVKIKQEIIAFGVEGIDPLQKTSPRVSAQELKQWLDEGKIPLAWTGTAVGIVSVLGYTPDVFMPPLMGHLLDASPGVPGHQHVFAVIGGFSLIGLAASVAFQRYTRR